MPHFASYRARLRGKCLLLSDYGPLGLVLRLGSMVGHPSNSWASCFAWAPAGATPREKRPPDPPEYRKNLGNG